jgi:hypothetical protein
MGLLGGIARTAVVAGTFTAVSNRVSRRQQRRWAQDDQSAYEQQAYAAPPPQPAPAPAPPPAPAGDDMAAQLTKLAQLHDSGVLTDEEFAASKAKVLGT